MEKEFIVWGVAPNETEEQVLYTKCTNLDMANKCAAYLEKEKGCTEPFYGEKAKLCLKIVPQKNRTKTFHIDKTVIKKR